MAQNFTKETCMSNRRILLNVYLLGPYLGHVLVKLRPCFRFTSIFMLPAASNGSNFQCKVMHANRGILSNVELIGPQWAHVEALLGVMLRLFLYLCFEVLNQVRKRVNFLQFRYNSSQPLVIRCAVCKVKFVFLFSNIVSFMIHSRTFSTECG